MCMLFRIRLFFVITGIKFQPSPSSSSGGRERGSGGARYSQVSREDSSEQEYGLGGGEGGEGGASLALREAFSGDCDQDL